MLNRPWLACSRGWSPSGPESDPECRFITFVCAYAGAILSGVLLGPCSDEDVRRYARACLVPAELLERADRASSAPLRVLRLPADELGSAARANTRRAGPPVMEPDRALGRTS